MAWSIFHWLILSEFGPTNLQNVPSFTEYLSPLKIVLQSEKTFMFNGSGEHRPYGRQATSSLSYLRTVNTVKIPGVGDGLNTFRRAERTLG
jgi:hypothetical protein